MFFNLINIMIVNFFGLLTPGPDFFYVCRMAASSSKRNTLCAVIGITLGGCVWAIASILGLAILFHTNETLHGIVMILGGGYLCYLGNIMIRQRTNAKLPKTSQPAHPLPSSLWGEIRKALFVNLSNVKVLVYFSSVMSFVLSDLHGISTILLVLGIMMLETFFYFYAISIIFSRPTVRNFYTQYSRYIDNFAGLIFLIFGLLLVYNGISFFS